MTLCRPPTKKKCNQQPTMSFEGSSGVTWSRSRLQRGLKVVIWKCLTEWLCISNLSAVPFLIKLEIEYWQTQSLLDRSTNKQIDRRGDRPKITGMSMIIRTCDSGSKVDGSFIHSIVRFSVRSYHHSFISSRRSFYIYSSKSIFVVAYLACFFPVKA